MAESLAARGLGIMGSSGIVFEQLGCLSSGSIAGACSGEALQLIQPYSLARHCRSSCSAERSSPTPAAGSSPMGTKRTQPLHGWAQKLITGPPWSWFGGILRGLPPFRFRPLQPSRAAFSGENRTPEGWHRPLSSNSSPSANRHFGSRRAGSVRRNQGSRRSRSLRFCYDY